MSRLDKILDKIPDRSLTVIEELVRLLITLTVLWIVLGAFGLTALSTLVAALTVLFVGFVMMYLVVSR